MFDEFLNIDMRIGKFMSEVLVLGFVKMAKKLFF